MTYNSSTPSFLNQAEDKMKNTEGSKDVSPMTLLQCSQTLEKYETCQVHNEPKPEPATVSILEPESEAEGMDVVLCERHNPLSSDGDNNQTASPSESSGCHTHTLHSETGSRRCWNETESGDTSPNHEEASRNLRLLNPASANSVSTKKSLELHNCEEEVEMDLSTKRPISPDDNVKVKEPQPESLQCEGSRFEYDMNGVQIPRLYQNISWLSDSEPDSDAHSSKHGEAVPGKVLKHDLLDSTSDFRVKPTLHQGSAYPVRLFSNYHTVQGSMESDMPLDMTFKPSSSQDSTSKPVVSTISKSGSEGNNTCDNAGKPVVSTAKPKQVYRCRTCNDTFPSRHYLSVHSQVHSGERHQCNQCPAAFSRLSSLKDHLKTHTGERPHVCVLCGSAFSKMSSLKDHTRIHTGEKPYKCQLCPASFSQQTSLKKHTRTHTGERPYKCQECDAAFAQQSNLKTHLRTHSGEKPYHCDVCDSAFSQLAGLRKHSKTHKKRPVEGKAVE